MAGTSTPYKQRGQRPSDLIRSQYSHSDHCAGTQPRKAAPAAPGRQPRQPRKAVPEGGPGRPGMQARKAGPAGPAGLGSARGTPIAQTLRSLGTAREEQAIRPEAHLAMSRILVVAGSLWTAAGAWAIRYVPVRPDIGNLIAQQALKRRLRQQLSLGNSHTARAAALVSLFYRASAGNRVHGIAIPATVAKFLPVTFNEDMVRAKHGHPSRGLPGS
jgi:hypothetical protein